MILVYCSGLWYVRAVTSSPALHAARPPSGRSFIKGGTLDGSVEEPRQQCYQHGSPCQQECSDKRKDARCYAQIQN